MTLNFDFMGQNINLKFEMGINASSNREYDYAIIKLDLPKYSRAIRVDTHYKDTKNVEYNPYEIHIVLFRVKYNNGFMDVGGDHMRYKIITMPCTVDKIRSSIDSIFKGTYTIADSRNKKDLIPVSYLTFVPNLRHHSGYVSLFDLISYNNRRFAGTTKAKIEHFVWMISILRSSDLGSLENIKQHHTIRVKTRQETFLLNYVSEKTRPFIDRLEMEMDELSAKAVELLRLHDTMNIEN